MQPSFHRSSQKSHALFSKARETRNILIIGKYYKVLYYIEVYIVYMIYSQTGVRLREYDTASGRFAISNMGKRSRRFFRYAKKMVHIREVRYRGGISEWLI